MIMTTSDTTSLASRAVGEIVAEDYRRASVFKRFGIDFCCGGGATLQSVCDKKGLEIGEVAQALAAAEARAHTPLGRVSAWEPGFLADYIVNEHHTYVRESIPVLCAFTQKVARVHGDTHPELVEIAGLFDAIAANLEEHMRCEEQVVFPAIKKVGAPQDSAATSQPLLRDVIKEMEGDHEEAGEAMRQIRVLSGNFTPPPDACNTYRAAFAKLEEFEDDLHRHVHLENNILFPKALALAASEAEPRAPSPTSRAAML